MRTFGQPIARREDERLLRGCGTYVDDGMLVSIRLDGKPTHWLRIRAW